jgi:hypothetical protein
MALIDYRNYFLVLALPNSRREDLIYPNDEPIPSQDVSRDSEPDIRCLGWLKWTKKKFKPINHLQISTVLKCSLKQLFRLVPHADYYYQISDDIRGQSASHQIHFCFRAYRGIGTLLDRPSSLVDATTTVDGEAFVPTPTTTEEASVSTSTAVFISASSVLTQMSVFTIVGPVVKISKTTNSASASAEVSGQSSNSTAHLKVQRTPKAIPRRRRAVFLQPTQSQSSAALLVAWSS